MTRPSLPRAVWVVGCFALVLHLFPRPGYEFHRDELLYLAMGDHLDLFRMQFPPLIAILAQVARLLPLELLPGIHLLSALALFGLVMLTALIARALGGGPHSQVLGAVSLLAAPLFMRSAALFQPVVFGIAIVVAILASPSGRTCGPAGPGSPPGSPRCSPRRRSSASSSGAGRSLTRPGCSGRASLNM